MSALLEKFMEKIPVEKAVKPFEEAYVYCNRWWTVRDGCILFYRKSPQCNSIEKVARKFQERLFPGANVRFLPVVFAPND